MGGVTGKETNAGEGADQSPRLKEKGKDLANGGGRGLGQQRGVITKGLLCHLPKQNKETGSVFGRKGKPSPQKPLKEGEDGESTMESRKGSRAGSNLRRHKKIRHRGQRRGKTRSGCNREGKNGRGGLGGGGKKIGLIG